MNHFNIRILFSCICALASTVALPPKNGILGDQEEGTFGPDPMLTYPLSPTHRTLMSGGLTNPCPSVLDTMHTHITTMHETVSRELMDEIVGGLRYVFQTKNNLTFPLIGSGTYAMNAIMLNLIEPDDTVLFGINSDWAVKGAAQAKWIGANVVELRKNAGEIFSIEELRTAVEKVRPTVVFLVHGISSTGALQDLSGVGDICHEFNCLLVVDMVSTVALSPVYVDEWKVDAAFCNSQKGLGSLVGLAPVTFSQRAYDRYKRRTTPVATDLFDLDNLAARWVPYDESARVLTRTTPLQQFYALREGLSLVAKETLENVWSRVSSASQRLTEKFKSIGVTPFVGNQTLQLEACMTYNLPHQIKVGDLRKFVLEKYQLDTGAGYFGTASGTLRVGISACNAVPEKVDFVFSAVAAGIRELGHQ